MDKTIFKLTLWIVSRDESDHFHLLLMGVISPLKPGLDLMTQSVA